MKAIKDNKVYRITENEKKRYLEEGYDIYDDDGKLQEYSPKKKITYSEHEAKVKEAKIKLAEENKALKDEVVKLAEENKALKAGQEKQAKTKKDGE